MINIEKTVAKKNLYHGKIISVDYETVLLPDGRETGRELVRHPGGVGVVAMDSQNRVYMVRQFRKPYEEILLEIPAGKLDSGEEPSTCGARELSEETGLTAERFVSLGVFYPSVGYTDEKLYLFLAQNLTQKNAHPDEDEYVEVEKIPLQQLIDRIMSGEIRDGKTIAALFKAKTYLGL